MSKFELATRFEDIFLRLLTREKLDPYEKDLSEIFEFIATKLLGDFPARKGQYFDGAVSLVATVKAPRKVEFQGDMWVGRNQDQWTEPFRATVTDKRITKQGIWVVFSVGVDQAESELGSIFGVAEQAGLSAPPSGGGSQGAK